MGIQLRHKADVMYPDLTPKSLRDAATNIRDLKEYFSRIPNSDCGNFSCSYYTPRKQTAWISENEALISGIGGLVTFAACSALLSEELGPYATLFVCLSVTVGGVYFMQNAANRAASQKGCLRVRIGVPWGVGYYADNSGYCTGNV